MLVVLINSFNEQKYIDKVNRLVQSMQLALSESETHVKIAVVTGGSTNQCYEYFDEVLHIHIEENMSDHNVYVGFHRYRDQFDSDVFRAATYLVIHDTCIVSKRFVECMETIERVRFKEGVHWIFAQTFGLYNIGICTHAFMLTRAKDFHGVAYIPKTLSIAMEQGKTISVEGVQIPPLLAYSMYTLANIQQTICIDDSFDKVDYYAVNGVTDDGESRWMNYIASVGMHKLVKSEYSFFIPLWCNQAHHPKDADEYIGLREGRKTNGVPQTFVPLIPYTA